MKILEIDIAGNSTEKEISRRELSTQFATHSRDLRPILSLRQMPTISRRGSAIVVNFRSVKLLIGKKSVLIFNLESEKISGKFVPELLEKIRSREKSRFEHVALEAALQYILEKTRNKYDQLLRAADFILESLRVNLKDEKLEKLLAVKKQISKLGKNARELDELLDELLDDDEELLELYFSEKQNDTDEIESVLENALEQIEDIFNRITELNENIDDTQEIMTLKLSSRRNVIIQFDLLLTSITAIFSFLAVIVGIFGMNILNTVEKNHAAFVAVIACLGIFAIAAGTLLVRWMRRKKIL
ncbi:CorA family magnesium transporter [bacterium]|jgi:magnesium transporter|nr:CorA family magnesium transporter [bacterium]MBT6831590.1 CorA family magnesium transporter [bacterium]MBT6995885.1 CorA family magnesium transporter [bacterium]MBT7772659.1 CorA family magnesium transporter [bacterium]